MAPRSSARGLPFSLVLVCLISLIHQRCPVGCRGAPGVQHTCHAIDDSLTLDPRPPLMPPPTPAVFCLHFYGEARMKAAVMRVMASPLQSPQAS